MRSWVNVAIGAIGGSLATAAIGYVLLKPTYDFWVNAPFIRAASEASLQIKALQLLERGDVVAVRHLLEGQLRIGDNLLSTYADMTAEADRDPSIESARNHVQEYLLHGGSQ